MKTLFVLVSVITGCSIISVMPSENSDKVSSGSGVSTGKKADPIGDIYIIIDKSDYELNVYDSKGWYATYPVVFGNNSLSDKRMEGDRNTPEGTFRIRSKRVHEKWYRFMAIDYPNQDSWEKFNQRKAKGEIPASARIGGGIGIHGTWPHEDFQIDLYKNWTLGCISMKNEDVEELYNYIPVSTKVIIRR